MMISHEHKFIMIMPPKNGTTSVASALMHTCDVSGINNQKTLGTFDFHEPGYNKKNGQPQDRKHATLNSYNKQHVEDYRLYGLIRNSYDRVISFWRFVLRYEKRDETKFTLLRFLERKLKRPEWLGWISQVDFFYTNCECKYQLKFIRNENMDEDFLKFCDDVGLDRIKLPRENATNHKHYTEYYDDKTRAIVTEKWARDIEYFGYKFGE